MWWWGRAVGGLAVDAVGDEESRWWRSTLALVGFSHVTFSPVPVLAHTRVYPIREPHSHPPPQNADCVALFPAPLPRPGFYGRSLLEYSSCVPASACPGVDAAVVKQSYSALLQSGPTGAAQVQALVEEFFAVAGRLRGNSTAVCGPPCASAARPRSLQLSCAFMLNGFQFVGAFVAGGTAKWVKKLRLLTFPTQVEPGGNDTATSQALRRSLLGYLNVEAVDCAAGERVVWCACTALDPTVWLFGPCWHVQCAVHRKPAPLSSKHYAGSGGCFL